MVPFSLPLTQAEHAPAFRDARGAGDWLAGQPQANAPAMIDALGRQVGALNHYALPARERFKALEVLRPALFAASDECQRRYEGKPLPLAAAEQGVFSATRELWRACRVGYLHCLQACLAADPGVADRGALIAHRALACLRLEQRCSYVASTALDGDFWLTAHRLLEAAEALAVVEEAVEDRLLGETRESTLGGQYAMLILLHLACPFALPTPQFAAITRWLARWREQTNIVGAEPTSSKVRALVIDLDANRPLHEAAAAPGKPRWLGIDAVLRKIGQRLELLGKGESPEALKLGSGVSAELATALLNVLSDRLKRPLSCVPDAAPARAPVRVAVGIESIFRWIAGRALEEANPLSAFSSRLTVEQLSVFGRVVDEPAAAPKIDLERIVETWQLTGRQGPVVFLSRVAAGDRARLGLHNLLALAVAPPGRYRLAIMTTLCAQNDGSVHVAATVLPSEAQAVIAEMREKPAGKVARHAAFVLPGEGAKTPPSVVLPAGARLRALSVRLLDADTQAELPYRLLDPLERGGDHERWSLAAG